jgi:CheY-like chemotaxis protein
MTKKILVVEDEPGNLNLISHFLNQAGYDVSGAKDGVEATELLGQSRFDLVLSDLRMPNMDGLALASHILSSEPATPILLMTAYNFDNRADMLELGVRCLKKPFSPNQLLSEIQNVIGEESRP